MATVTVKITGTQAVANALRQAGDRWTNALAQGVYLAGSNVMTRSKRLVPVDTGALKGSGYVTLPVTNGTVVSVELGYGGPASDYALKQHEDLTLNHPDGGQAKFLSAAVDEFANRLAADIAAFTRRAFQQGNGPQQKANLPTDPWQGGGK